MAAAVAGPEELGMFGCFGLTRRENCLRNAAQILRARERTARRLPISPGLHATTQIPCGTRIGNYSAAVVHTSVHLQHNLRRTLHCLHSHLNVNSLPSPGAKSSCSPSMSGASSSTATGRPDTLSISRALSSNVTFAHCVYACS